MGIGEAMPTVTLEEFNGTVSIQLDSVQTQMFEEQLRKVRGGWLIRLINWLTTPRVRTFATAPDYLIKVDNQGQQTVYEIHGGYVLRKVGETTTYNFYLGLLMLEWLYGPTP